MHCNDSLHCLMPIRYSCDCSGTGFTGARCEIDIDDCAPNPCRNGATCVDGINDFACRCYDGYEGKTCSTDIPDCSLNKCQYNGTCLERSNQLLYNKPSLPAPFNGSFSYSLAAGFLCTCPAGELPKNILVLFTWFCRTQ